MSIKIRSLFAVTALAFLAASCATSSEHGQILAPSAVQQIKEGMPQEDVLKLLGPPDQSFSSGVNATWTYTHSVSKLGVGFYTTSGNSRAESVSVTFVNGKVKACSYSHSDSKSSGFAYSGYAGALGAGARTSTMDCNTVQPPAKTE